MTETERGTSAGRRAVRVLVCLIATLMLLLAITSPASAATKRSLSLKVAPATVTSGELVTVSGTLSKSPKGTKVRIERLTGRQWKQFKAARTTSTKGAFKISFKTTGTGKSSYRAVAAKTKKLKAVTSKVRAVTVRSLVPTSPPVPPVPVPIPAPPVPVQVPPVTGPVTPDPVGVSSTVMVSRAADGTMADGNSDRSAVSADGRYVTYYSGVSNLVSGDTNGSSDVFVWDRQTATTVKVTQGSDGSAADDASYGFREPPAISANGRYIAFTSFASNLVAGDTNELSDVFVWDRETSKTIRVTRPTDDDGGGQNSSTGEDPSVSADGRYVAFEAYRSGEGEERSSWQVFVWDRQTSTTSRVSQTPDGTAANEGSESPSISSDGRYISYDSSASNLVADDSNGITDVFVWDRQTATTVKATRAADGTGTNGYSGGSSMSDDGRFVAYESSATNTVPGASASDQYEVFLWDRTVGTTVKLSRAPDGSLANSSSSSPSISGNGRYVAYSSYATNIDVVAGDRGTESDVFVWDSQTGDSANITPGVDGDGSQTGATNATVSSNGRYVAFESDAANHVPDDTNDKRDIFLWDRLGRL